MIEQEVSFESGPYRLCGTLTLPEAGGRFPCVLMVTGSGQVDRDENHVKMRLNAFKDVAGYLGRYNIASLRYDKRGVGASQGDYWATGFYDNAADALAALNFLKTLENIQASRVFILGHSEGAFIATRLAGSGAETAGVILLAGGAQSGEALLTWQAVQVVRGLKGFNAWLIRILHIDVARSQQKQLNKIKKSTRDVYRVQLINKINARWFREFLAYNAAEDLPHIQVPVLAITGSKDIQVDPADLDKMAQLVRAPFESHLIPDMTHILRVQPGEAGVSTYKAQIQRPIEESLLSLITAWVTRQAGA